MTVFLVRHGTIDGMRERLLGRSDVGLNAQGRREVADAAERCRRLGPRLVVTSPRRRTLETASVIAESIGCDVEIVDAFDEIDFGEWTGRPFADLSVDPEWRRFNQHRDTARIPGGEALSAVSERIRSGLDQWCQQCRARGLIVVTHAEIIRGAVLLAEGHSWSSWALHQPEPASITPLAWPFARTSV